jgi:hypothetical protein
METTFTTNFPQLNSPVQEYRKEYLGTVTYEGWCHAGVTLTSKPIWVIRKTTIVSNLTTYEYALNGEHKAIWDDRTTYFTTVTPPYLNTYSTDFDGANDYVGFNAAALNAELDTVDYTVSLWVKLDQLVSTRTLFCIGNSASNTPLQGLVWVLATGVVEFVSRNAAGTLIDAASVSPNLLTTGVWYHITCVRTGKIGLLYINGAGVATSAAATDLGSISCNTATLGVAIRATTTSYLDGKIDEVSIWNKALSTVEIQEIYNVGFPTNCIGHSAAANLIHYYRMGDGDTFPDVTDNTGTNNGLCVNMVSSAFNTDIP